MKSINPATEEELASYQPITKEEALSAVDHAHDAYAKWKDLGFSSRKDIIVRLASIFRENAEKLSKIITLEMGKRISESQYEIEYCAKICEYYAENAEEFLKDQAIDVEGARAYVQHTPLGVLLGVMPWNFPFYQVIRFAIPNIMAGNTVLMKHASNVPQCAEMIEKLLLEAGLPSGVYTNLFIPTEFIEPILSHKKVRGVSLTGSEPAGASVASIAGKNIKRSVLELGGNDPFIILEGANLAEVVEKAIKGRMVNTGQSCVSAKRFIVVEPLAKKFIAGMKKGMAKMKMGDPMDEETQVGPLSTERAAVKLQEQVTSSIRAGAKAILGGDRPKCPGAFFNPTILTGVTPENPTFDQELFGPVATIHVVKDEAEAIELANNSSYGLGGSVHTTDIERAHEVARQIDTGMVFINRSTKSQAELPFGGTKNSGYGRELSEMGILEFVNRKLINQLTE
ncbi:NAD-dependent succinate-semialdehyde dehydrogenase [Luteolibacter sp. AS25]|uniref:NAD-dependent succinate-semialdehyde dehydrogenase n=1 Tax=Luteolibacter sp. AS25 TaxID=3135776 RepID=UPI00398B05E5